MEENENNFGNQIDANANTEVTENNQVTNPTENLESNNIENEQNQNQNTQEEKSNENNQIVVKKEGFFARLIKKIKYLFTSNDEILVDKNEEKNKPTAEEIYRAKQEELAKEKETNAEKIKQEEEEKKKAEEAKKIEDTRTPYMKKIDMEQQANSVHIDLGSPIEENELDSEQQDLNQEVALDETNENEVGNKDIFEKVDQMSDKEVYDNDNLLDTDENLDEEKDDLDDFYDSDEDQEEYVDETEEEQEINEDVDLKEDSKKKFVDGLRNFDKTDMEIKQQKEKIEKGELDIENLEPQNVVKLIYSYQEENEQISKDIEKKEKELER